MEHINGSHPLRVTLGEVIIDSNHVNSVSCQSIEEDRQRSSKSLTFTSEHLSNFALMKDGTSKKLNIEMHHVPNDLVTTSYPSIMINSLVTLDIHKIMGSCQGAVEIVCCDYDVAVLCLSETFSCTLDDGKYLCTHSIKSFFESLEDILFQLIDFCKNRSTILNVSLRNLALQLINLSTKFFGTIQHLLTDFLGTSTQFIVAECLNLGINLKYILHQGTISLKVTRLLVAKNLN